MKKNIGIIVTFILLIGLVILQSVRFNNKVAQYEIAVSNNKAYEAQLDVLKEESKVFQFSVEQLKHLNDSTIKELDSVRKQLGIKDKQIQQMSKVKEKVYIVDTLIINDTIFENPSFSLDTCLGDEWYQNCFHLAYPNEISSQIDINTDTDCFIHASRETINPPCKTWIARLFQKKHTVIHVTVRENNPYAKVKECKFIKVYD